MAEQTDKDKSEQLGIVLLIGGAAAFMGSLVIEDQKLAKVLQVAGLGAAGVGLYYLVFEGLFGKKAGTGETGGAVGAAEDVLIGGMPNPVEQEEPTVYQPPAPGTPTLDEVIPYTGRVLSPSRDATIPTYFGRDFYRLEVELTNNTGQAVSGLLELHADEVGTYGGTDAVDQVQQVALAAGETKHVGLNMRSTAGYGSWSTTTLSVRFAGHHIATTSYVVT